MAAGLVAIAREPIDVRAWEQALDDPRSGAVVAFEGRVRDHSDGRSVAGLSYEVYDALALREGERILAEARARFAITGAALVHRAGDLDIGDCAVWVGAAAAHRDAAFNACRYIIDEVKARLPVWKRERFVEGDAVWVGADGLPGCPVGASPSAIAAAVPDGASGHVPTATDDGR